ncbi:CHASE domain-containing protein [Massilia pinisoli]|uniref:CHASE domain-containing protein n=1 Tax=Massilia pinisoli TaxID=1772194 RepID=A0ABT1ZL00_9BURK|nr:CHASE domain-containing protein [Massilia pinisoli]MCS0580583.1 CHASE domain-containing protein [Massilia pinisoli]
MADIASRNTGLGAAFWAGGCVLAVAVGTGVYLGAAHAVDLAARARFDHLARTGTLQLDGAVRAYADVVRGLAGLFEANGGTATRLQFHRYVEALGVAEHYPALESVNFAAYVEDGARDAFVAAVRADRSLDPAGYPDFAIRPAGHRPSHTVLTYLEPLLPEKFGVDLTAGAPVVAQTMARTRDSGGMAASGKPVVVERPVRHLGMGLRAPVYRISAGGTVPLDVEGRRAAYVGSVGIGFSVPALVRGAVPDAGARPVALQLYAAASADAAGPLSVNGADSQLYDGAGPALAALAGGDDLLETVLPVRFDDNLWKARFVARRADLENGMLPWLAGAAGFGATLLAWAFAVRLMRARRAAEARSGLLDLVLDHVDAAIWLQDRDRRYRYVNAKMAALCGLPAAQVVGRRDRDVWPAAQADALWESDRAVLALGEKRAAQDTVAGRPLWRVTVPVGAGVEPDAVLCVATDADDGPAPRAGTPAWPETRAPRPHAAGALDGVTVLLVEDDAFHQLVARELLEDAGAQVVGVDDGADALARLAQQRVDCVLMDLHMPDMDGYEATRRIRLDPGLAGLKVIALTANGASDEEARCVAAGMDGFVAKPAAPDALVATVARVLGRGGAADEPAGTLLDMRVLSDAFGGQPERMRKFAFLFLDAARDGLREIDRALAAHDVARAAAVAHRLKSAARTVGALAFGDVCADLERLDAPDAARALAARLHGLLARLEHHIAAELGARRQDHKA